MKPFNFIDLFAGIGGFRLAFEAAGGSCVFASEWDRFAQKTYAANFGHIPAGDITQISTSDIPDHDILTAGFPCFAAGTLILTIEGYKPIETIQAGELVLTHLGRWRKVTATMSRASETTMQLKGQALLPTITTDEHPYYIRTMKQRYLRNEGGKRTPKRVFADPIWLPAHEIRPIKYHKKTGYYAGQVLPTETIEDTHTEAFWWLAGRYLADGWRVRRKNRRDGYSNGRVVICCHKDEAPQLAEAIDRAGFHSTKVEERTAIKFHIVNVELYRFLEQFGHKAPNKTIPGWCLQLDLAKASALLQGYISGDGYHDVKNNVYSVATTSATLALIVALLAQKVFGTISNIKYNKRSAQGVIENRVVNQRHSYTVNIPCTNRSAFIEGNYGWKLIRSNEPAAAATVYNLAVEEDESYMANGAIVHNCQPFSIAGVSKNNALGRTHGFAHATQGTLFFDVARIIADKRPMAFVLENVKNLRSHDRGNTFKVIQETLVDELGYHIQYAVLDAKSVVPQHRERIYIVGFREPIPFQFPKLPETGLKIRDILEINVPSKYTLSDKLWDYLQNYARKHQAKGNGFGFGLVNLDGTGRTLSARYYKDGSEILIPQPGKNPRRLTPRECARLMGYPDSYQIVCSDSRAYKQFGNSVVVPVVSAIAGQVITALETHERNPVD